jgi:hypothetical protein
MLRGWIGRDELRTVRAGSRRVRIRAEGFDAFLKTAEVGSESRSISTPVASRGLRSNSPR